MPIYWIDAGVLIQAERGPYGMEMVPQFWQFIHEQLEKETIQMCRRAFQECTEGGYEDELAAWCRSRKKMGLCRNETQAVQAEYGTIVSLIHHLYPGKPHQVAEFLRGADGWVIACALATDGVVVTMETERSHKSKIKIPTVAKRFDVRCVDTYQMLRELGFSPSKR